MTTDLIPVSDVERMAVAVAKSRLFGMQSPDQALALMLVAQAEGRHPASAARDFFIVQGRPTLKADAILARFQEAGGRVQWHTVSNERAEATFSHPAGGNLRLAWTMDDARHAGLVGKAGPWKQFPRAMLRARLISEAVRTIYPAVVCGTYTPEEVRDFAPVEERNVTPVVQAPESPVEAPVAPQVDESAQALRDAANAVAAAHGKDYVSEILGDAGYTRLGEIPPEERQQMIDVFVTAAQQGDPTDDD